MDSIPQKQCSKCLNRYPATADYFYRDKHKKDGLKSVCISCKRAYRDQNKEKAKQYRELRKEQLQQYRDTHKEEKLVYNREYRIKNRETLVEYQIRYNFEHRQEKREYAQQRRITHREIMVANHKRYTQTHKTQARLHYKQYTQTEHGKAVIRAIKHRRRANKKMAGGTYTIAELQDQCMRQHNCCYYCQAKLGKDKGACHVDHVTPLSRGGTNNISNIVLACPSCNLKKHNKLLHEWPEGRRLL